MPDAICLTTDSSGMRAIHNRVPLFHPSSGKWIHTTASGGRREDIGLAPISANFSAATSLEPRPGFEAQVRQQQNDMFTNAKAVTTRKPHTSPEVQIGDAPVMPEDDTADPAAEDDQATSPEGEKTPSDEENDKCSQLLELYHGSYVCSALPTEYAMSGQVFNTGIAVNSDRAVTIPQMIELVVTALINEEAICSCDWKPEEAEEKRAQLMAIALKAIQGRPLHIAPLTTCSGTA